MTDNPSAASALEPRILHRESGWLVVDKPAGWHTVAQRGGGERCIEQWLRGAVAECAALPEAGLVHRLDQSTSGCLVVARTAGEQQRLRNAFRGTAVEAIRKTYLASARTGLSQTGSFALYFTSRHKGSAKVSVRDRGERHERGECTWCVRGPAAERGHDIVEVELVGPGRRHQIRAGLAFMGHPLLGDHLYGGALQGTHSTPALHAWRVVIGGVTVTSPPDARFAVGA